MQFDAVLIAGPTASGKSNAALALARALDAHIVNADAMQIYRELRILTARPSDEEMAQAPHHLFGHASVAEPYSVGRYQGDAARVLREIRLQGARAIFVGGTGLYFSALTDGIADMPAIPQQVRDAVRGRHAADSAETLHTVLAEKDPAMASALRPSDRQRILRALEVLEATGRSLADWQKGEARAVLDGLKVKRFVLEVERETLRARIEARFHAMVAGGALEEVARLDDVAPSLPSAKILGLRELRAAVRGEMDRNEAIARAVTLTRQYAKRQVTWARHRMADWTRIPATEGRNIVTEMLAALE